MVHMVTVHGRAEESLHVWEREEDLRTRRGGFGSELTYTEDDFTYLPKKKTKKSEKKVR